MRKRYILLKETPEYKAGAVFEDVCDDGTQNFKCMDNKKYSKFPDEDGWTYDRVVVVSQPEWFEEVDLLWLTKEQLEKVKKLLKL